MRTISEDVVKLLGQLVEAGWLDKDIGASLGIPRTTVGLYRRRLGLKFRKMKKARSGSWRGKGIKD